MSTKATYEIKEGGISLEVYLQHDGYEEGASLYYKRAIDELANSEGFIASFIRANNNSTATIAKDHNDTEFHYEMDVEGVTSYEIDLESGERRLINTYTAKEFCDISSEYREEDEQEHASPPCKDDTQLPKM